jgi:hypothetical protein
LDLGIRLLSVVSGCDPRFQVGKGGSPPLLQLLYLTGY